MTPRAEDDAIRPSGPSVGFEAERNSAVTIGVLHLCVVFALPALIWNSPVVDNRLLLLWSLGQVFLAIGAFASAWSVHKGRVREYARRAELQSLGIAVAFGALPWLGAELAGTAPAKHALLIAAIAVTSISASNSAHITSRRPFFWRLVTIVATSYALAYLINDEVPLAVLTILWCLAISAITRVGHRAVLELLQLRRASEEAARHDHLTGLLSRSAFFEELGAAAGRRAKPVPGSDRCSHSLT